jgi:hypothetical protein
MPHYESKREILGEEGKREVREEKLERKGEFSSAVLCIPVDCCFLLIIISNASSGL